MTEGITMNEILNRTYKDSVFRIIFNSAEKLIELYNAIFGTDYGPETPVDINTIEEAIYVNQKNDISFIIDHQYIVLTEHQSTVNLNMPMRNLMYITDRLKNILEHKELYRKSLVKVPRPSFIVLYNGKEKLPAVSQLKLSDSFYGKEQLGESGLQLTVSVYNINEDANCELLEKCKMLKEYSQFVSLVRKYADEGPVTQKEMSEIVRFCIQEGILVDFMKEYGTSIVDLLRFELTEEEARDFYRRDGFEEGREEGIEKGKVATARNMLLKGIDIETVCECTELKVETIKELWAELQEECNK